jgi:hypothetical protein
VTEMKHLTRAMGCPIRTLAILAAISPAAARRPPILRKSSATATTLFSQLNAFRPLDAITTGLESQFGIAVSAEDPVFPFRGDMMDRSSEVPEVPEVGPGTLVPARWGFELRFPVNPDGSPQNVRELLAGIVAEANLRSAICLPARRSQRGVFLYPHKNP